MNDEQAILRRSFLLKQLADAPQQKLAKFKGTKASPKDLALDKPAMDSIVGELMGAGYITAEGKGKSRIFSMTASGA